MTKKKKQPVLVVLAVLIVLLASVTAGLCVALFTRYTWVAGGIREKGNSRLDLRGETISLSDFEKLTQAFPGREILWDVPLQSGSVASDASQVTLLNPSPSDWEALELMENLTFLDATGCRDYDRLMDFQARHPQCQVRYSVLLGGREYPNDAQTVTLSGADAAQAELLSYLPRLTQVEFTISAPTEAEMDDLAAAFPDVFFRWPIPVGDATVDSAAETLDLHGQKLAGEEIAHLVSRMPNLKYLIIGETGIHDLSPLTNLKKLSYLEMFTIPVEDYSPLLACTGLEDLNLGLTYGEPDVIAEMTWLKNLWWCDANGANNSQRREAVARMCENLQDTKIAIYVDHPTAGGWRNLPNYFKMRDLMGMFYLT